MKRLKSLLRCYPAVLLSAAICLGATLCLAAVSRLVWYDARPTLLLVGDCSVDNFRFWPGRRIHELVEAADPAMRVYNVAEPGALPGDLYPLAAKAALAVGRPTHVVIGLEADRFVIDPSAPRLMYSGRQLRWLPLLSVTSWKYFAELTPSEMAIAILQRGSEFFYLAGDKVVDAWLRQVQWPQFRKSILENPESPELVLDKSRRWAAQMDTARVWNRAGIDSLQRAVDFRTALELFRRDGARTVVVLLPYGNHDLIARTHTPSSQAKVDSLEVAMRRFLESTGVDFIDMASPTERGNFPDSVWYDQMNIGRPEPFFRIAQAIGHWRRGEADAALVGSSNLAERETNR